MPNRTPAFAENGKNDVHVSHALSETRYVKDVRFDELETRIRQCRGNELVPASGEIVVSNDRMSLPQQAVDKIAAYEFSSASDKYAHRSIQVHEAITRILVPIDSDRSIDYPAIQTVPAR